MLKKIKKSLKLKFNLIVISAIIIIVLVSLFAVDIVVTRRILMQVSEQNQTTGYKILNLKYPGLWEDKNGQLYKGKTPIKSSFLISKDIAGYLSDHDITYQRIVAIFLNNQLIDTNINKQIELTSTVREKVLKHGQDYHNSIKIDSHKYYVNYSPLKDKAGNNIGVWMVGVPFSIVKDIMGEIFLIITIILVLSIIVIQFALSEMLNRLLFRPLSHIIDKTRLIASGDLTTKVELDREDEMGNLAQEINIMTKELKQMVKNINCMNQDIYISSQDLNCISEQTTVLIEGISSSTEEVTVSIETVNNNTADISNEVSNVNYYIQRGLKRMNAIQGNMDNIIRSSRKSIDIIKTLEQTSDDIKNVTDIIAHIAEQTNLLSLNASIEAARASYTIDGSGRTSGGDYGRGFVVVAEEIRNLSVETQDSVDNIGNNIEGLILCINDAVKIINHNNQQIEKEVVNINECKDFFEQISVKIDRINKQVKNIVESNKDLLSEIEEIVMIKEEEDKSAQSILEYSKKLNNFVKKLNTLVNKFKV